jgi:hypothetical protein
LNSKFIFFKEHTTEFFTALASTNKKFNIELSSCTFNAITFLRTFSARIKTVKIIDKFNFHDYLQVLHIVSTSCEDLDITQLQSHVKHKATTPKVKMHNLKNLKINLNDTNLDHFWKVLEFPSLQRLEVIFAHDDPSSIYEVFAHFPHVKHLEVFGSKSPSWCRVTTIPLNVVDTNVMKSVNLESLSFDYVHKSAVKMILDCQQNLKVLKLRNMREIFDFTNSKFEHLEIPYFGTFLFLTNSWSLQNLKVLKLDIHSEWIVNGRDACDSFVNLKCLILNQLGFVKNSRTIKWMLRNFTQIEALELTGGLECTEDLMGGNCVNLKLKSLKLHFKTCINSAFYSKLFDCYPNVEHVDFHAAREEFYFDGIHRCKKLRVNEDWRNFFKNQKNPSKTLLEKLSALNVNALSGHKMMHAQILIFQTGLEKLKSLVVNTVDGDEQLHGLAEDGLQVTVGKIAGNLSKTDGTDREIERASVEVKSDEIMIKTKAVS